MDPDEEFARRLQAEYDEEARTTEEQEHQDAVLAQELAARSHDLSDSDDEVMEENNSREGKSVTKTDGKEKGEVVEKDRADDEAVRRNTGVAKSSETSAHSIVSNPNVAYHTLSDDDEDPEGRDIPQAQEKKVLGVQEDPKISKANPSLHKEGSAVSQKNTGKKRPLCKFGSACYRKNPWHLDEFYHPHLERDKGKVTENNNSDLASDSGSEPKKKRQKESGSSESSKKIKSSKLPFSARLSCSQPFNLFLNKNYSIKETHEDPLGLVFPDLLNPELGEIVESAQLNFMVDLEFLMTNYKFGKADSKPLLVMYGEIEGDPKDYASVTCTKVNIPFQYGTHHTKMMLFQYKDGLRVVVHTANLVPDDWYEKTQGFWVSPLFPELENEKAGILDGESPTRFKRDLVDYLQSYKVPDLTRWSHIIKKYDFSSCNVLFVGSTPGYHLGEHKDRWGHMKVRRVIRQHASPCKSSLPIISQCSSIGSLGKDARSWLSGELGMSFTGAAAVCASPPMMKVVYPSEDDICNSSQGWMGGSCLPYNSATHEKQTWLMQHFHLWRAEKRKRTKAMPHIKTYTRLNKNCTAAQFLLLTSANLSKAAWGMLQKQNSQLFIRSYEAGVLMLPKFLTDSTEFDLTSGAKNGLSLPYDVPLTSYPEGATPWFMNTKKKRQDIFGRTYP